MNWLIGAIPGVVAALAVALLLRGYHMLRTEPQVSLDEADPAYLDTAGREHPRGQSLFTRIAAALADRVRGSLPPSTIRWLQLQVDMAGRPAGLDVDAVLVKIMRWLVTVAPLVALGVVTGQVLYVLLPPAAALLVPLGNLAGTARRRREQIDRDLPDFLDVLAVTVSAGLGFRSALGVVADRFGGPLAEEVRTVLHQITNGASVRSAFASLRDRTRSEAIEEFVTAYLQAEELGAPLVDTLNQIAWDMRRAAAQRMRQLAGRVEPRISLVMTLVLIPGSLIILIAGMVTALGTDGLGTLLGG